MWVLIYVTELFCFTESELIISKDNDDMGTTHQHSDDIVTTHQHSGASSSTTPHVTEPQVELRGDANSGSEPGLHTETETSPSTSEPKMDQGI